jgi:glycosidase
MRLAVLLVLFLAAALPASAQVVTSDPVPAVETEAIDVYFHATQGSGGLAGYTGDVYAHTGVITNLSNPKTGCTGVGWRYVKTAWGENTDATRLQRIGTDEYRLHIENIRTYYGVPPSEELLALAFVFRSSDSSREGKDTGGCDIFVPLVDVAFASPVVSLLNPLIVDADTVLAVRVRTKPKATVPTITLRVDGQAVEAKDSTALTRELPLDEPGTFLVTAVADWGIEADSASFSVTYRLPTPDAPRPPGIEDGITYDAADDTRATLSLFAPWKEYVFVIGDFTGWQVDADYQMKRHAIRDDSVHFWLELEGLEPGREYAFQYLVDGGIRMADPYTAKILHPDDAGIGSSTYPDLKPYPNGSTVHATAVLETGQEPYAWQTTGYERPPAHELVIYELLVRDFIAAHDFSTLGDTLGYLERLGVNAIELMPVNEFENNESWGYNTSFYFAPDKYYGPADGLNRFVDEAHRRGIAVILDMVFNHSYGQSPMVRQYFAGGKPTEENPWYNVDHNFLNPDAHWGYDFDHESTATQHFVDRVMRHWMEEYRVDGFRLDFSKGIGNNIKPWPSGDVWGSLYDADRVRLIRRMADALWSVHPGAYLILEHLADNPEEKVLADYGLMLWGNMNYNYNEATMGWLQNSDFSWGYFGRRSWTKPGLVTYMESHDEERLMVRNRLYGSASGAYSTRELGVSLDRMKAAAAFFYTVPGPRMIWQFGELGYDISIDVPCRVCNKPIRWFYQADPLRAKLFEVHAALIHLRRGHLVFTDPATGVSDALSGAVKHLTLTHPWNGEKVVVVGNFGVAPTQAAVPFPQTGTWHDFFGRTTIDVTGATASLTLPPGQFHVFTSFEPSVVPEAGLVTVDAETEKELPGAVELSANWPNPFNPSTTIAYSLPRAETVQLDVFDAAGRLVARLVDGLRPPGGHELTFDARHLASGVYLYRLRAGSVTRTRTMLLLK